MLLKPGPRFLSGGSEDRKLGSPAGLQAGELLGVPRMMGLGAPSVVRL